MASVVVKVLAEIWELCVLCRGAIQQFVSRGVPIRSWWHVGHLTPPALLCCEVRLARHSASFVQLVLGAMALPRTCKTALCPIFRIRHFHTSSALAARKAPTATATSAASSSNRRPLPPLEPFEYEDDLLADQAGPEDDVPEPMHRYLQQQREMLYYLRLIEHEMPKLVGMSFPCHGSASLYDMLTPDGQRTASRLYPRMRLILSSSAQCRMVVKSILPLPSAPLLSLLRSSHSRMSKRFTSSKFSRACGGRQMLPRTPVSVPQRVRVITASSKSRSRISPRRP